MRGISYHRSIARHGFRTIRYSGVWIRRKFSKSIHPKFLFTSNHKTQFYFSYFLWYFVAIRFPIRFPGKAILGSSKSPGRSPVTFANGPSEHPPSERYLFTKQTYHSIVKAIFNRRMREFAWPSPHTDSCLRPLAFPVIIVMIINSAFQGEGQLLKNDMTSFAIEKRIKTEDVMPEASDRVITQGSQNSWRTSRSRLRGGLIQHGGWIVAREPAYKKHTFQHVSEWSAWYSSQVQSRTLNWRTSGSQHFFHTATVAPLVEAP